MLYHALNQTDVWAIIPERVTTMYAAARRHLANVEVEIEAAAKRLPKVSGSLAFLPLYGVVQQRPSMFMELFGGTSTDAFGAAFSAAIRNPEIKGVVIDVDSPGGTVSGVEELSSKMHSMRGAKPTVAVSNPMSASAAYWIATAADQLAVTNSGDVGSIGVFSMHVDESKALENEGVKVQFISAGKYKTEGNPYEALSEEARQSMQARVDGFHDMFISAVARNRGRTENQVRNDFGQGRVVRAQEAMRVGMVDRIATLEKVVQTMGGNRSSGGSRAERDQELTDLLVSSWQAGEKAAMEPDPNMPMVGDRVKLVVAPHMEGHDEGVVRQVVHGMNLGIEFDSMPGEVHHWYLVSDVMVIKRGSEMEREPMSRSGGDPDVLRRRLELKQRAFLPVTCAEDL